VCLWDLTTVSAQEAAVPKLLMRTGKELHSSGIFSLDVQEQQQQQTGSSSSSEVSFATASKDKTIAISTLGRVEELGWWSSNHHTAKVGDVRFRGKGTSLLASVGDDGVVAIHDYRTNRIVAESSKAHHRPHSVVWNPVHEQVFMTAGHDKTIKLWDLRRFGDRSSPIGVLEGHVPLQETRCKKIHRPVFYHPVPDKSYSSKWSNSTFVLTGGQNSHSLSMFHCQGFSSGLSGDLNHRHSNDIQCSPTVNVSLSSRGKLPDDCGDAVCIAVNGSRVAVSTDQAEVLLLQPTKGGVVQR
jgi:WD40 repeat protein